MNPSSLESRFLRYVTIMAALAVVVELHKTDFLAGLYTCTRSVVRSGMATAISGSLS